MRCSLITAVEGGTRVDGNRKGLDWADRLSFRLGSTATCHSSSAPARNHPISSTHYQKVTGMVVHTLSKQRESLLLRAPSPGTLVPLNHFWDSWTCRATSETLTITHLCCINSREHPNLNPDLILPINFSLSCFEIKVLMQWVLISSLCICSKTSLQLRYDA